MVNVLIPPVQAALWFGAQQGAAHLAGRTPASKPLRIAGAALVAFAAGGGVDALRRFITHGTTWHPWDLDSATHLVTDGPNAVSRNPMYAGIALALAGTGLLTGRPWTALAAAGFVASVTPQVRREEAALAATFGVDWDAYAHRVRRWV